MRILLTNDDSIHAPGIRSLISIFKKRASLTVVAPETEKSAVSHALTLNKPLLCRELDIPDVSGIAVRGTPVDCVKLALDQFSDPEPDIVISGINQGPNTGWNIFYSGTVAAAQEAVMLGVPAMAVSLGSFVSQDFVIAARITYVLAEFVLQHPLPGNVFLNVNIPACAWSDIAGFKLTVQGRSRFRDYYKKYVSPDGSVFYWIAGDGMIMEKDADIDESALKNNYVSITPLRCDLNMSGIELDLRKWFAALQAAWREIPAFAPAAC